MLHRRTIVLFLLLIASLALAVPVLFAQDANKDVYGRALPDDAAPYDQQMWQEMCPSDMKQTTISAVFSVYQRFCSDSIRDQLSDSLVVLDQNLSLMPAAADKWEPSADGTSWTFHLHPGQKWSDGTPLTANDYVASYRWMVDPKNAYDFVWMWQGVIKNWNEAVAGEVTPDQIGMTAVDDLTLKVDTDGPRPYLPGTLYFWGPIQAKALAASGPNYMLDPKTSVSSGPYKLKDFAAGDQVVLEANPDYNGYRKPYLKEIRLFFGDINTSFQAFQSHTVDRVNYEYLSPADFDVISKDPVLSANYHPNFGDFRTDYLFFDTYNPPFDNQKVRLAFAKALDRESIVKNVIGAQFGIPAYSFLAPGFPASDSEGKLKSIQAYDCDAAKQLLSDAGYPGGKDFPAQELELRGESAAHQAWFVAAASSISQCLGVTITVNNMEYNAFMTGLLARPTTIKFGAVSYGMDYLDPSNMLGVWVSTGRHSWRNADFDKLVADANVLVGDPDKRTQMYQDAEKILVQDVGGIFLDHRIQGDVFQPYASGGTCFTPDKQGVGALHWGNAWCWSAFYITKDVANVKTYRSQ